MTCTKASTVTTPDAEKKNLWPRALEAHRALPPVEKKNLITLWGKGPLKAFEGFAGNAALAFKWPHFTRLKEGCVSTELFRQVFARGLSRAKNLSKKRNGTDDGTLARQKERRKEEKKKGGKACCVCVPRSTKWRDTQRAAAAAHQNSPWG